MSSETELLSSGVDEIQQYRQLSLLAVAAFLLGLLSPIALAHPAAWSLPAAAVLAAATAGWRIWRHQDSLMGIALARIGLFLGLLFLVGAPARFFSERALLNRQAREFAEQWLEALFQGDLNRAHQGALPVGKRQPEGTLLDEYYANNESARLDRDNFFGTGTFLRLTQLRPGTTFQFNGNHVAYRDRGDWYINQRFLLFEPGTEIPYPLQTEVYRTEDEDGVYLRMLGVADARSIDAKSN